MCYSNHGSVIQTCSHRVEVGAVSNVERNTHRVLASDGQHTRGYHQ